MRVLNALSFVSLCRDRFQLTSTRSWAKKERDSFLDKLTRKMLIVGVLLAATPDETKENIRRLRGVYILDVLLVLHFFRRQ